MIRTQVSLDEEDYRLAKQHAARLNISVAEFVRRAVRDALPLQTGKPWMSFAGMVESGDPKSSQRIDELIYGRKD
jgi:hypothetical protein